MKTAGKFVALALVTIFAIIVAAIHFLGNVVDTATLVPRAMSGDVNAIAQLSVAITGLFSPDLVAGHACAVQSPGARGSAPAHLTVDEAVTFVSDGNNRIAYSLWTGYLWSSNGQPDLVTEGRVGGWQVPFPGTGDFATLSINDAKVPALAVNYLVGLYTNALNTVDPALWKTNPNAAAEQVNLAVLRPDKAYSETLTAEQFTKRAELALKKLSENDMTSDFSTPPPETPASSRPLDGNPTLVGPDPVTRAYNYFVTASPPLKGFQAAAIIGNLEAESSMNPAIVEYTYGYGHGYAQWSFSRWKSNARKGNGDPPNADPTDIHSLWGFAQMAGKPWTDEGVQLDFLWHEITVGREKGVLPLMLETTTVETAAAVWFEKFERPGDGSLPKRIANAQRHNHTFGGSNGVVSDPVCHSANSALTEIHISPLGEGGPEVAIARQQTIAAARAQLGVRYSWGGGSYSGPTVGTSSGCSQSCFANNDPTTPGFDCSGLMYYALAQVGIKTLPRTSAAQWDFLQKQGFAVSREDAQPGDLVFFTGRYGVHHVGMVLNETMMINAPQSGDVVKEAPIDSSGAIAGFANPYGLLGR